ncbi:hypothetical protein NXH76_07520 [Blautia schinkii]|nr:hypothetical protein [Blautia schinkii]
MKEKSWRGKYEGLKIPVQYGEIPTNMEIDCDGKHVYKQCISLSKTRIDEWKIILLPRCREFAVRADIKDNQLELIEPCRSVAASYEQAYEKEQQVYHFQAREKLGRLWSVSEQDGMWRLIFRQKGNYGDRWLQIASDSLLAWSAAEVLKETECNVKPLCTDKIKGDIRDFSVYELGDRKIIFAVGEKDLSIPLKIVSKVEPAVNMEKLRTWKRDWMNLEAANYFKADLRFRIAPSNWPNIRILPAEGKTDDIWAEAHEFHLKMKVGMAKQIRLQICGITLSWSRDIFAFISGPYKLECPPRDGIISIDGYIDKDCGEIFSGGEMLFLHKSNDNKAAAVDNVSGNLDKCKLDSCQQNTVTITSEGDAVILEELTVFGLRKLKYERETQNRLQEMLPGKVLFQDKHFCVYDNRVSDEYYGKPDAYVPDSNTVISLVRAVEEFRWRDTKWGDMVRVLNRDEIWHPGYAINKYPQLKTGIQVVDAAYNLALDTFRICESKDYALSGQEEMWSAGAFQGKGQGFGVWMRDTAHIALRCGNLIDPETARRTLLYTTGNGFDNGCDGACMSIVGLWDYYLATDDITAVYEAWPKLLENIEQIDTQYCTELSLVHAPQSTSNDAFEEPEGGGFCLGTEVYDMKAYEAMAYLGKEIKFNSSMVEQWAARGAKIREQIGALYWNEEFGYFTSGPKGSEAYENGYWETSGEECVLWDKFSIADKKQKKEILEQMEHVAMCEYGVVLFPYRKEQNHFCGAVWGVWQAGIAAAASEAGREDILYKLLYQQIRICIMNKTFYEVIDAGNGTAWRWPAQLWHAAGFISIIYYGVLGISYDEQGMRIRPLIAKEWAGMRIYGFRYGRAEFDIISEGYGKLEEMLMDNDSIEFIPKGITGKHCIRLRLNKED